MTERPIIFNDAMSLAVVELRKTVTRRPLIINGAPARGAWWDHAGYKPTVRDGSVAWMLADGSPPPRVLGTTYAPTPRSPFGMPGDKLWVREVWRTEHFDTSIEYRAGRGAKWFDAMMMKVNDYDDAVRWSKKLAGGLWAPSIHMPRWASRTALDVLEVRVERLQSMSEEDARAEGFETRAAFCGTWDAIYPTMGMRHNPWVWVVRFKRQGGA